MWRVHKSRVAQGLGATKNNYAAQNHRAGEVDLYNDSQFMSVNQLVTGQLDHIYIDAPFCRMHQSIQNYPSHLSDWDDLPMYQVDNFERLKQF